MKILVVEDDAVARTVARAALRRLEHEVLEARDGEEAWAMLRQHEDVRVVVSDWVMPQGDGLDLCRRVRGSGRPDYQYFILVTSRDASEENRLAAADAGVDDFLTKPLQLPELWMRLRVAERILGYSRQVQQLQELLPMCSYCKKIRDDRNYWQQLEGYLSARTGFDFSHSVCPDCHQRVVVPEMEKLKASLAPRTPPTVERKHQAP